MHAIQQSTLDAFSQAIARHYCGAHAPRTVLDTFANHWNLFIQQKPEAVENVFQFLEQDGLHVHPTSERMITHARDAIEALKKYNPDAHAVFQRNAAMLHVTAGAPPGALHPGMTLLRGAGVLAGVGLIGHGLHHAGQATEIDPSTGEHHRHWGQTLAGLGEAAGGAAMSWASYVLNKRGGLSVYR